VVISAPTKLVKVDALAIPEGGTTPLSESNDSRVTLGLGAGLEVGRVWALGPRVAVIAFGRAQTASVTIHSGGGSWSPGRAFISEAGARIERGISPQSGLFAALGVSHWSGPSETAPFKNGAAALLVTEAGITARPARSSWRFDLKANLTRFGANDDIALGSGSAWRFILGVSHER